MNSINYIPIVIPYTVFLSELGIEITTTDPSKRAELGVYSAENGIVLAKVYSNLLSLNTFGYRMTPCALALAPGLYFLAFNTDSSSAIFVESRESHSILGHSSIDFSVPNTCYVEANTFSNGMPNSAGDISLSSIRVPRILARLK